MTDASNPVEPKPQSRPLDESLYSIDDQALQFMREQTGIQDPEELRKHIFAAQAEAYAIHPYNCIRKFAFVQLKLGRLPAYEQLLALGKNRKGAIFLDIGCCFGNDIRKAVHDGYPIENIVASDLHPEFWEAGHHLFKSTPETFPVPFVPGDAFNPAHLDPVPPFYAPPDTPRPQLSTLTSLNPLRGHVSAIHASAFFHLFDEEPQFYLARALGGLLSPEPGSMILGVHGGRQEKGFRTEVGTHSTHRKTPMFCHSPESWTELWNGQVFKKGTVKVEAFLHETPRKDLEGAPGIVPGAKFYILVWSVTRL
ncbi:uncharacterized protein TRAVEDRAFT_68659 [Trametes versicolor FP-101664 SS1]|uniref:uncharacterized protein n=1 Tax=Trametes versicolor (strain FP-101664) TaxID=717944 RepID=UPI00046219F3|nr:uncharacterized protein TRAVEDRAFT_68659 [Trametes versicolor FP-101664 SS1]EIW65002.1 hypothetical protein TRAVEDRAFT_68659 [Trametes versicolor FP-101664 SS1]